MSTLVRVSVSLGVILVAVTALVTSTNAQSEAGSQVDARITARSTDDGRVEFALQLQLGPDEWGERLLPRRRFFPAQIDHSRWLNSSTLGLSEQGVIVRIIARQASETRVEFGLQWVRTTEHGWGERFLPDRRFFPRDVDHTRWLNSSTVTIGEYYTSDLNELPVAASEGVESGGDESGEAPAYVRYKFLGGVSYGIGYRDGQSLTMHVPEGDGFYREYREFEGRDPLFGLVMIFPSGLELEMHPDLIDGVLDRTDITDPLAVMILDSLRHSREELAFARPDPGPGARQTFCVEVTEPFPRTPVVFPEDRCATVRGTGSLTLQYLEFELSLTIPTWSTGNWLLVAVPNVDLLRHELYLGPGSGNYLGIDWATGEEVGREIMDSPEAVGLTALFDAIAESVSVTN